MFEEMSADRRELDGSRAARSVEHLGPDDAFERRDLLADGRLRVAQPIGGTGERALRRNGVEGDEMANVEVAETAHEQQDS